MISHESESFGMDARSAIADSMMVAQAHLFLRHRPVKSFHYESGVEKFERDIRHATRGKCERGSIYALTFLANKYSSLFRNLAFVDTDVKDYNDGWDYHRVFIAQDKENRWYSASPANYSTDSEENRLTRLDEAENLEQLMKTIRMQERGIWPTSEFIESALESSPFSLPKVRDLTRDKRKLTALKISAKSLNKIYYISSTETLPPWENGQIQFEKKFLG